MRKGFAINKRFARLSPLACRLSDIFAVSKYKYKILEKGRMQEINDRSATAITQGSFLDVLGTVIENARLIIAGALAAGLIALGVCFMLPQTYQSVAVVQADQSTASLMLTATVLDPVIASLGLARDTTVEQARSKLRKQIKTVIGRTDKLLTLTVSARSPQQAQALATALMQRTFQESKPKGSLRLRLETQLAEARVRFRNAHNVGESLRQRLELSGALGTNAISNSEVARGYAELLGATSTAQSQIVLLESQLEGLSDAQVVQFPTLAEESSGPKKGLIVIGATMTAGLALLLFVFIRQAVQNTTTSETNLAKLVRIRKALHLSQ